MRSQHSKSLTLLLLAVVTLASVGCEPQAPGGLIGTPAPENARELSASAFPTLPTFSLTLKASAMSIERGTSASNIVGIVRENGFTGSVTLSLDPATGFNASFTPSTVSSTATSSKVALSVASSVAPGTYNLTLRGTSGSLVRTVVLPVTVTLPPPSFNVTLKTQLGVLTSPLAARQNTTTRMIVQVDPVNGFSSPVSLSLEGLPTGVFPRQENFGSNQTTVHLTVENFSIPGSYGVTVRAEGGGLVKLAPFTLEVTSNPIELDLDTLGAGALDLTFGQTLGGIASSQKGFLRTVMALHPADGSIITANDSILSRFSPEGVLDREFERDTASGVGNSGEPIHDLSVQADGRIVTVGTISISDQFSGSTFNNLTAMRFTASGALDTTFGVNGRFRLTTESVGSAILPLEWGKTLIAGVDQGKLLILRLTPGGNADPDFNGDGNIDGKVLVDLGTGGITRITSVDMVMDSSGRPVAATIVNGKYTLVRLLPNGQLDATFGVGGRLATNISADTRAAPVRIAMDAQERILLAGTVMAADVLDREFLVARFLSNGSADSSFGQAGKVIFNFAGPEDTGAVVALQQDGKILIAGNAWNSASSDGTDDFSLARLGSNGSLDASFGQGGKVHIGLHDFAGPFGGLQNHSEFFDDLIVLPDGRILAAGHARNTSSGALTVLMRFNP
jgi:uncharacterized delta-60 repeat protein